MKERIGKHIFSHVLSTAVSGLKLKEKEKVLHT